MIVAARLFLIDQPVAIRDPRIGWLEQVSTEINTQEGNNAHDHA